MRTERSLGQCIALATLIPMLAQANTVKHLGHAVSHWHTYIARATARYHPSTFPAPRTLTDRRC